MESGVESVRLAEESSVWEVMRQLENLAGDATVSRVYSEDRFGRADLNELIGVVKGVSDDANGGLVHVMVAPNWVGIVHELLAQRVNIRITPVYTIADKALKHFVLSNKG